MSTNFSRAGWVGVILLLGVVFSAAAGREQAQTPLKLGYVNARGILAATPEYQQAESIYSADLAGFEAEVSGLQSQLDSAVREYDQQSVVLSPSAKQSKEQEIRALEQRLRQRTQQIQQRANEREQELLSPIQDRLNSVLDGLRAERNYSFIFDVSAPTNPIVAADGALDLTPLVIQRLRASR